MAPAVTGGCSVPIYIIAASLGTGGRLAGPFVAAVAAVPVRAAVPLISIRATASPTFPVTGGPVPLAADVAAALPFHAGTRVAPPR